MMTQEKLTKNIGITTMWRGIDDSSIEEIYYFLYHKNVKNQCLFPSTFCVEAVKISLNQYLVDKCLAKLICMSDFFEMKKPQIESESYDIPYGSDKQLFIYSIQLSGYKYPIIVKLTKIENYFCYRACSFDSQELKRFSDEVIKNFLDDFNMVRF